MIALKRPNLSVDEGYEQTQIESQSFF